jgi:hypothetical protein
MKLTALPENSARLKSTVPPENTAPLKLTAPPEGPMIRRQDVRCPDATTP